MKNQENCQNLLVFRPFFHNFHTKFYPLCAQHVMPTGLDDSSPYFGGSNYSAKMDSDLDSDVSLLSGLGPRLCPSPQNQTNNTKRIKFH